MDPIFYRNEIGQLHRVGGPAANYANGNKAWMVNGQRHRENDLPAIEYTDGRREWWVNGKLHRDGGLPAIDCGDGTREWWVNGLRHRDNGLPASEYTNGTNGTNGTKEWWVNGQRHREGGLPAVEWGKTKTWWVNGRKLSFKKGLAYSLFCEKMRDKIRIRAQKKIYYWWIQICYDLEHPSGCGRRMALKNLNVFETMMKA